MGSGTFKCEYAQYYVRCGGCQNDNHPFEKEAEQFENYASSILSGAVASSSSIALPGGLRSSSPDCADCLVSDPGTIESTEPRRNRELSFDAERKAKFTCTLDNQLLVRAVESCIDDMTVIYEEILAEVEGDYSVDIRNISDDYWKVSKKDMVDACNILRATSNNAEIGNIRLERCALRTKSAVREMVSYARQKYPR